jgi:hypothetical protein
MVSAMHTGLPSRDQQQRALQRAGVHREHEAVRRRHLRDLAAEHARHHRLVGRERCEAVDAGQVDHAHARAADERVALAPLDGHARVVADARAQPGERVEQRRLARVGAADEAESDGRRVAPGQSGFAHAGVSGFAHAGSTWTLRASLRRRQSCVPRSS